MGARERALEKALSQKPSSGTREQAERYVAEKVSGVSRESGTRQNFSSPVSSAFVCLYILYSCAPTDH